MKNIYFVLFIALFSNAALGFRLKRQSNNPPTGQDLIDRYGWNGQQLPPWMNQNYPYPQNQYPFYPYPYPNGFANTNNNGFPNTNPNGFPNINPNGFPNGFPNTNNNGFPNTNNNGFPNTNPNGLPNTNPNRLPNGFPNTNNNGFPNTNTNGSPNPVPTSPPTQAPNGSSTQSPDIQACIRSCPVTSEYNPVCGSNGRTYDNPGRLTCAQLCGESVTQLRAQRCPATTTPAPVTS